MSTELLINHQDKLNAIQARANELTQLEGQKLVDDIYKKIDNGEIDEGIAKAISKQKPEYCIINVRRNRNIDYTLLCKDVVQKLKSIYEPTYKVEDLLDIYTYSIYINVDNKCIIF